MLTAREDVALEGQVEPKRSPFVTAVAFMLAAAILIPLLNAEVKYLGVFYPVIQLLWCRYFGHVVFMLAVFAPRKGPALFRSQRPWLQIVRSLLFCLTSFLMFCALQYVPVATAAAVSFTAPMVVLVLAPFMLGEQVSLLKTVAVICGFVGALVVIQPGGDAFHPAVLLVLFSACTSALTQILSRKLASHDTPETSNTYMAAAGFVLTSLMLPFFWQSPDNLVHLGLLISMGVLGGSGHYCLVRAFEVAPAPFVAPFTYLQIVGASLLGYLLFAELPNLWSWIGTVIIVLSGLVVLLGEQYLKAQRTRKAAGSSD
ncbi:membrane protein [Stutzerimonas stutzeri]|uniref:Membrane protein n=1 Tax=Stutzerimonas stutzeri TaxID=316 RepID=W8R700_STUST|nr:DMT family transporter [Stutzerimonas stutzeri]AHL75358.1 membrane protein [Stutzerimonas stutzeri]MCQ4328088.1 DMT family transporter [Stutzerimonas stutzeri]